VRVFFCHLLLQLILNLFESEIEHLSLQEKWRQ